VVAGLSAGLSAEPVTVRVPATSANLGPGFDSLGLAWSCYDEVTVEVLDDVAGPPEITVEGEGAGEVPLDENHLVHQALCAGFRAMSLSPPRLRLHCANDVPHGRGLGSSSAAIVSGLWAARSLVEHGEERWSDQEVLDLAARMEGHPDNVAPAVLGGFTIAYQRHEEYAATSLTVQPGLSFLALVPQQPVATHVARTLLPSTVTHDDAARNAARAALLAAVLSGAADPGLALVATEDWLHQTYRGEAMAESVALMHSLRRDGVAAVISGAGPSVLVLGGQASVEACRARVPEGWTPRPMHIDTEGATCLTV
jgi:homoserine kinase